MKSKTKQSTQTDGSGGEKMSANILLVEPNQVLRPEKEEKISSIKFVAIEFDQDRYKSGEDELNACLKKGFRLVKDFQTASGLVVLLAYSSSKEELGRSESCLDRSV